MEAERLPGVQRRMRRQRACDGRRHRDRSKRSARRRPHERREEARRAAEGSHQPRRIVRARAGGDPNHVSPRSHRAAAEARRRARHRSVQGDRLGRGDRGAGVKARRARSVERSEVAGDRRASAAEPPIGAARRIRQAVWRSASNRVRPVRRRCAAASERHQLRPRSAADIRSGAGAVPHRLRRRFPRHVELAGRAECGVWRDASGSSGHPRQVRAGGIAHDDDGRERGRMDSGEAGDRRRARARPCASDESRP